MEFGQKIIREIDLFDSTRFFFAWTFLIFRPTVVNNLDFDRRCNVCLLSVHTLLINWLISNHSNKKYSNYNNITCMMYLTIIILYQHYCLLEFFTKLYTYLHNTYLGNFFRIFHTIQNSNTYINFAKITKWR